MAKKHKKTPGVEKPRGETWVGKRPAVYKDRKKDTNRQGEHRKPKHKKSPGSYASWGYIFT